MRICQQPNVLRIHLFILLILIFLTFPDFLFAVAMLKRFRFVRCGDSALGNAVVVEVLEGVPTLVVLLLSEPAELWLHPRSRTTLMLGFFVSFAADADDLVSWRGGVIISEFGEVLVAL